MKKYFFGVKEEKNILRAMKIRKANWIGHILRRNCLLKHAIEGKWRKDDEEDVGSHWLSLREREGTGN